jgi:hypothetical protein
MKTIQAQYNDLQRRIASGVHIPSLYHANTYSTSALMLLFFSQNLGKICTKKELITYLRKFKALTSDPQPRHIGMQWGFYFLVSGAYHPRARRILRPGEYCLMALKKHLLKPFTVGHRYCKISNSSFESLKAKYHNRCIVCGSKEGQPHFKNPTIRVTLQKGHADPRKPLDIKTNCVPMCSICNRAYKNNFIINNNGILKAIK